MYAGTKSRLCLITLPTLSAPPSPMLLLSSPTPTTDFFRIVTPCPPPGSVTLVWWQLKTGAQPWRPTGRCPRLSSPSPPPLSPSTPTPVLVMERESETGRVTGKAPAAAGDSRSLMEISKPKMTSTRPGCRLLLHLYGTTVAPYREFQYIHECLRLSFVGSVWRSFRSGWPGFNVLIFVTFLPACCLRPPVSLTQICGHQCRCDVAVV